MKYWYGAAPVYGAPASLHIIKVRVVKGLFLPGSGSVVGQQYLLTEFIEQFGHAPAAALMRKCW